MWRTRRLSHLSALSQASLTQQVLCQTRASRLSGQRSSLQRPLSCRPAAASAIFPFPLPSHPICRFATEATKPPSDTPTTSSPSSADTAPPSSSAPAADGSDAQECPVPPKQQRKAASAAVAAAAEKAQPAARRWTYRYWKRDIDLHNLTLPPSSEPAPPPSPKPSLLQRSNRLLKSTAKYTQQAIHDPKVLKEWSATAWHHIKVEAKHYWAGCKLLWADIRTAIPLLKKMAQGRELSWRENRQLRRTAADVARAGPFLLIVIIPFMELALPIILKLFPSFLPSTFQSKDSDRQKRAREMKLRMGIAELMQEAVANIARKQAIDAEKGDDQDKPAPPLAQDAAHLLELLNEVRHGRRVSPEDMAKLAKLFEEIITLDKMSRKQLVRLAQFFNLIPYASDNMLRYQLSRKISKLRADDQLLSLQLNSLTKDELRSACHERGIRSVGLTTEGYRRQLRSWLDLSLKHKVPESLLLLSRPFGLLEQPPTGQHIRDALLRFDEHVLEEIIPTEEETPLDNDARLALLKLENQRIQEEEKQREAEEQRAAEQEAASRETVSRMSRPITPSKRPNLFSLSSKLLGIVYKDLAEAQSMREKMKQIKEKQEEMEEEEEEEKEKTTEASAKTESKAKPTSPAPSTPVSAPAEAEAEEAPAPSSWATQFLKRYLESRVNSLLLQIEEELAEEDIHSDGETDQQEVPPASDEELLAWIQRTLAAQDVQLSEGESRRLLYMLRAMCEHEGVRLSHATLTRLSRLSQEQSKEDKKKEKEEEKAKEEEKQEEAKKKEAGKKEEQPQQKE